MIELQNEYLSVGIEEMGAELCYIRGCDGTEYLWCGDPAVWAHRAPLLFPICGGLKEDTYVHRGKSYHLSKHGFAKESLFKLHRHSKTDAELVLTDSAQTRALYPFSFRLTVHYSLSGETLTVTYTVENSSEERMYFSIGAHEGYACPEGIEEYEVRFDTPQHLESFVLNGNLLTEKTVTVLENASVLPLSYDFFAVDALVFKSIGFGRATLAHKNSAKRITVTFDGAKYFLLWTKPFAGYICLEPWQGIPDGEGSGYELAEKEGILALDAGEVHRFVHTVCCRNQP